MKRKKEEEEISMKRQKEKRQLQDKLNKHKDILARIFKKELFFVV